MARRTGIGSQKDITFGIICLFLTLSACGGGSGGSAGSVTSLAALAGLRTCLWRSALIAR